MCETVECKILRHFKRTKKGTVFFTDDFLQYGNAKAVSKALERLVEKEEVARVARGIYARLETNEFIGKVRPSVDKIIEAIVRRDKARIIPTGVMALNALGLSTQVPMKMVYLTDGSPRMLHIGKITVKFKKVSPKNLSVKGEISSLVIQALKEIGKGKVTDEEKEKIILHLKNEDVKKLEHDILLAPEWIRIIMREALD